MDVPKGNKAAEVIKVYYLSEDGTLQCNEFEEYFEGVQGNSDETKLDYTNDNENVPVSNLQMNKDVVTVAGTEETLFNDDSMKIKCAENYLSFKSNKCIAEQELKDIMTAEYPNSSDKHFALSDIVDPELLSEDSSDEENIAVQLDFSDYELETEDSNDNIKNVDVNTDNINHNIENQKDVCISSVVNKLNANSETENMSDPLQENLDSFANDDEDKMEMQTQTCSNFTDPEEPELIRCKTPEDLLLNSESDDSFNGLRTVYKGSIINDRALCSSPPEALNNSTLRCYSSDDFQLKNIANASNSSLELESNHKLSKIEEKRINLPVILGSSDSDSDEPSETTNTANVYEELKKLAQKTASEVNELERLKTLNFSSDSDEENKPRNLKKKKKITKNVVKTNECSSDSDENIDLENNPSYTNVKKQNSKKPTSNLTKDDIKNKKNESINEKINEGTQVTDNTKDIRQQVISKFHKTGSATVKPSKSQVPYSSEGGKYFKKKNNCVYCLVLQDRLDRHLILNHGDEPAVKVLISLPKRSKERLQKFAELRNLGNEIYNKDETLNPDGIIICSRRKRVPKKKSTSAKTNVATEKESVESSEETVLNHKNANENIFTEAIANSSENIVLENDDQINKNNEVPEKVICEYCRGYYSIRNIHNHIRLMHEKQGNTNSRQILASAKKAMDQVHPRANEFVRDHLIPHLRYDEVSAAIRYDLLIILFANKYGDIHEHPDQHSYVRGHMRLLGKLLIAVKTICPKIDDLATVFRAKYWPYVLQAIKDVSGYDENKKRFAIPYNAETLPILIRKCFKILRNKYTKTEESLKQERLTGFMNVFEDEVQGAIYVKATLTRKENNRHKDEVTLPSSNDIKTFESYLQRKRNLSLQKFKEQPRYIHWLNLSQTTLAIMQLFNRRRAGETGRMEIEDYNKAKTADENSEFFKQLTAAERAQRLKYKRIDIQGKKIEGKGSIYITSEDDKIIKIILQYRNQFNVSPQNRFLFGLPNVRGHNPERHLSLCTVMRELSKECSLYHKKIEDKKMRGTLLRQQGVTKKSSLKRNDDPNLFANHMGHSVQIQNTYYRKTIDSQDVEVTKLLETINAPEDSINRLHLKKSDEGMPNDENNTEFYENEADYHEKNVDDTPYLKISNKSKTRSFSAIKRKEREESEDEFSRPSTKKKPVNQDKRRSWSEEEKDNFNEAFKVHLRIRTYPSTDAIRRAMVLYPALQARSENVIRTRFSNIYNRNLQ